MKLKDKKGIMGPVISVFILVLVVSILAGLTFLFVSALKTNVVTTVQSLETTTNESDSSGAVVGINNTGFTLRNSNAIEFKDPAITTVWVDWNQSNGSASAIGRTPTGYNKTITSANYSLSSAGVVTNLTNEVFPNVSITYTYLDVPAGTNAYLAVNGTEAAGYSIIGYLPLIFLAIIFGAILTLVLKIILPYLNLGQSLGGF